MKKLILASTTVIALALGTGTLVYSSSHHSPQSQGVAVSSTPRAAQAAITQEGKTVSYTGVKNQTALETLRLLAKVETQSSDYGDMVVTINSLKANATSEYWAFYVDDKLASVGAGVYKSTGGERVEWRLEKF